MCVSAYPVCKVPRHEVVVMTNYPIATGARLRRLGAKAWPCARASSRRYADHQEMLGRDTTVETVWISNSLLNVDISMLIIRMSLTVK